MAAIQDVVFIEEDLVVWIDLRFFFLNKLLICAYYFFPD